MLGKVKSSRKRRRPNMSWIESIKQVTVLSFKEMSRDVEDRAFWKSLINRITINQRQLDGT